VLAGYLAYRLDLHGTDWWGTASTLQDTSVDAPQLARYAIEQRLDPARITDPDDRRVLMLAIFDTTKEFDDDRTDD
jgi:hypothetical protein